MNVAIIAPTGLLNRYCTTKYHLALLHMMEDPKYMEFYAEAIKQGDFVILDNSVIELGQPMDIDDMVAICDRLQPTELVMSDFPGNPTKTWQWAEQYGPLLKDRYPAMKLMAVPQWGTNKYIEDWMTSYHKLVQYSFVDSIGIPKFLAEDRPKVCSRIAIEGPVENKEYHLLGTWGNPIEVLDLSIYSFLRGVDTKAPVRFGQRGILFDPLKGLLSKRIRSRLEPLEFDDASDPMPIVTWHNIRTLVSWAHGGPMAEVIELEPVNGKGTKR